MTGEFSSGRVLGTALLITGLSLAVVAVTWLAANALSGMLRPGGFVLGIFFLVLFILPVVLAGILLRRRGAEEAAQAASSEERRALFERDRVFRQILRQESSLAAQLVGSKARQLQGEAAELLAQAQRLLESLAEDASQPVDEADWLDGVSFGAQDVGDLERFGDLLLAALRRIREAAAGPDGLDASAARHLLDLARSARRQFALRDDLLLRGRRVPPVAPLQLLRAEASEEGRVAPESLRPGSAVSLGASDYLVTAHVSYLAEGRRWHALILRGEVGERRLQLEPGADTATFMEPSRPEELPDHVEESGTASVSIQGLAGETEGVVADYRLTIDDGGRVGWWERWPDGERCYLGRRVLLSELRLWPAAVDGTSSTGPLPSE